MAIWCPLTGVSINLNHERGDVYETTARIERMDEPHEMNFQFLVPTPPEGEVVEFTAAQMEQALLEQLAAAKDDPMQAMWNLAQFYKTERLLDRATEQFSLLLERTTKLEAKAEIVLALGQTAEKSNDFDLAVRFYRQALSLEPTDAFTWYFIHNNLAYSLNQLGRYADGEVYCRRAIGILPGRQNAHKNLGLALQGQGRYREAAQAFVTATQSNASDARSLGHLETLLTEHPELAFDFVTELECCRKAVALAKEGNAKAEAAWRKHGNPPL